MKTCKNKNCTQINPQNIDNFNKNSKSNDGLQAYCRVCHKQKAALWNSKNKQRCIDNKAKWYEENREVAIAKSINWHKKNSQRDKDNLKQRLKTDAKKIARISKNSKLRKFFGISIDQYDVMFKSQNGCCAICGEQEKAIDKRTNKPRALAVDHCHKTGKIRQLLCNRCNHVLGLIKDSITICDKVKNYLCLNEN